MVTMSFDLIIYVRATPNGHSWVLKIDHLTVLAEPEYIVIPTKDIYIILDSKIGGDLGCCSYTLL